MIIALVGVAVGFVALDSVRLPAASAPAETTFVCAADVPAGQCTFDRSIAQFSATENRVTLSYREIPVVMIDAVIAAEDRDFFKHNGVDPFGIARAFIRDLEGSGVQQGGSTITQQYVKTAYLSSERTLSRKLKEAALSIKLERKLSKEQILERYLNEIYFGRGAYGVEAAARAYFGIGAKDLQLYQAAYLAGLIRAPELADANRNPEEADFRRSSVLRAMREVGFITADQERDANAVPWKGNLVDRPPRVDNVRVTPEFAAIGGGYLTEWVRQQMIAVYGNAATFTKGLRVYLTVDPNAQRWAYQAVTSTLNQPGDPSAAMVALDDKGAVTAMVGGTDFARNKVNYALGTAGGGSGRGAGSTFKPIALAAFVEAGNSLKSRFPAPKEMVFPGADNRKDWKVDNFDEEDFGIATVEEGTWKSMNTLYAQIALQVGPKKIAAEATKLGISAPVAAEASTVLGTSDVSVLDMATAYSVFSNRGALVKPFIVRRVEAYDGTVLFDAGERPREQVISQGVADTVTTALRGVIEKGTGKGARLRTMPAAGKTGTTNEHRDAWFVGYTCRMTTAVWMGYDTPTPMLLRGVDQTGGALPATMWKSFMDQATVGQPKCSYPAADAGTTVVNPELVPGTTTTTTSTTTTTTLPGQTTAPPVTPAPGPTPTSAPSTTAAPLPGGAPSGPAPRPPG